MQLLFALALLSSTSDLTLQVGSAEAPKLHVAFARASEHLARCGACTVTIQVPAGEQRGKAGSGSWTFPETIAPSATLRILGGWDGSFKTRAPLANPTILSIAGRRGGPVLHFSGKKTALRELHLSGFFIDVAAGNTYDGKTGALHKGSSSSWPVLAFSLAAERLIIADNTFLNSAHTVGAPRIVPLSPSAEVVVRNNFFINNVYCWQVVGLPMDKKLVRQSIVGNTFLLNYPFNPDKNTSNPGVLEIGNNYTADHVEIRGNLFAYNNAGAIFPQWDENRGPKMTIADNLFFRNGLMFGGDDAKGAVVGKFAGSGIHGTFSAAEIAEDFSWTTTGNVVLDPALKVAAPEAPASSEEGEEEPAEEDDGLIEIVRNEAIDSFARRLTVKPSELPFPGATAAQKYGASASRVVTP